MITYWLYFLLPFAGVLSPLRVTGTLRTLGWTLLILISIFFIGLRTEVGGDWANYLDFFYRTSNEDFSFVYGSTEPGYVLLNWISGKLGWGIYGANTACAALFVSGLAILCLRQPFPTLAWLIATPYLIVVVGMGYTRQSVAAGFVMAALTFLEKRRVLLFLALIFLATMFHKSALLIAPLCVVLVDEKMLSRVRDKFRRHTQVGLALIIVFIIIGCLVVFFSINNPDRVFSEFREYVLKDNWHSEGGMIRALMNAGPAVLLLMFHRQWRRSFGESRLWFAIAGAVILLLVLTPFISTFSDRIAIYLIPIQIYVLSRVPLLFKNATLQGLSVISVSGLYVLVLYVWINYAEHAYYWVPYKGFGLP